MVREAGAARPKPFPLPLPAQRAPVACLRYTPHSVCRTFALEARSQSSPSPDGATVTRQPMLLPRVARSARVTAPPSTSSIPPATVR